MIAATWKPLDQPNRWTNPKGQANSIFSIIQLFVGD